MIRAGSSIEGSPSSGSAAASAVPGRPCAAVEPDALRGQLVAQRIVAHELLGGPQDVVGVVGAIERPEEVAGRRQRNRGAFPIVPRLRGEVDEQPLRLGPAPRPCNGPREQQPRLEAPARLHRRAGEPLGQRRIERGQRPGGRSREEPRVVGRAGGEPPEGDPEQIAAAPRAARLHRCREPSGDRLAARRRQLRPHRLGVQPVDDIDEPPPAVGAALDELAALEPLERLQLVGLEQPYLERGSGRHQLQQPPSARAGVVDAQVDELGQPGPGLDLAAPAPDAAPLLQEAAVEPVPHELAQEQDVAPGQLPHRVDAGTVDRPPKRGLQQRRHGVAVELPQLQPQAQLVLRQPPHRIGPRLVTPESDDREDLVGGDQLMDKRRRRVVEELAVVDAQHEPPPGSALDNGPTPEGE